MEEKYEIMLTDENGSQNLIETREGAVPRVGEKIEMTIGGQKAFFTVKEVTHPLEKLPQVFIDWTIEPSRELAKL